MRQLRSSAAQLMYAHDRDADGVVVPPGDTG